MDTLVSELPEIPQEVYQARDDGRLVLFCGAGVSVGAGCPSYRGLIARTIKRFGHDDPAEREALREGVYDRHLQLVERRVRERLRRFVVEELVRPPKSLDLHQAILRLASDRAGRLRLVTTNFDTHFEAAATSLGVRIATESAPRIAPPKDDRWNSLVYLHGRIETPASEGRDLVLTSGDFGRAYLTEGWASRFVTELFERHDVIFVGYSASDVVMRYVLDAFTAGRSTPRKVWALQDVRDPGVLESRRNEWQLRGVTLVPYNPSNHHEGLTRRLALWAGTVESDRNRIERLRAILDAGPENLVVGAAKSELSWLLGDPRGDTCKALFQDSKGNETPELLCDHRWLDTFDELGFLGQRFELLDTVVEKERAATSRLVGDGGPCRAPLGIRARTVAWWLSRLATDVRLRADGSTNSEGFLRWVQGRASSFHPQLLDQLRWRLANDSNLMDSGLLSAWNAITNEAVNFDLQEPVMRGEVLDLSKALERGRDTDVLQSQVLRLSQPFARFSGRAAWMRFRERAEAAPRPSRLKDHVWPEIVLRCHAELDALEGNLAKAPAREQILAGIGVEANALLRRALELADAMEPAFEWGEERHYQTISTIGKAHRDEPWTFLADLVWSSSLVLDRDHHALAWALYRMWLSSRFATERRLALHAARHWTSLGNEQRIGALVDGQHHRFWDPKVEIEVLALLESLPSGIPRSPCRPLFTMLRRGPDPVDEDDPHAEHARAGTLLRRLLALTRAGVGLPKALERRMQELLRSVPAAYHEPAHARALRERAHAEFVARPAAAIIDFDSLSVDGLAQRVIHHPGWDTPEGRAQDEYLAQLIEKHQGDRVLEALSLAARSYSPSLTDEERSIGLVESFPDRAMGLLQAVIAKDKSIAKADALLAWDILIPIAMAVTRRHKSDDGHAELDRAINHPAGKAVDALFHLLLPDRVERNVALSTDLKTRIEPNVAGDSEGANAFRAIVASRLYALHFAEPAWTAAVLIPLFDWTRPEVARACWQGFLWGPRLDADLFRRIHAPLLEAFRHPGDIARLAESLCGLLVSIALDGDGLLAGVDTQRVVRAMPAEWRRTVAWLLWRRVDDAKDGASHVAGERVVPWLRSWPDDKAVWSDRELGDRLVTLALESDGAFPGMVELLLERGVKLGERSLAVHRAVKDHKDLIRRYPADVARLFHAVLPSKDDCTRWGWQVWRVEELKELIRMIQEAAPSGSSTAEVLGLSDRL